jgi:hypothetical protein
MIPSKRFDEFPHTLACLISLFNKNVTELSELMECSFFVAVNCWRSGLPFEFQNGLAKIQGKHLPRGGFDK